MKKFNFRYESVLKMRINIEYKIKNELAKLIGKRQELMDSLNKLHTDEAGYAIHIQELLISGNAKSEMHQISSGKKFYLDRKNQLNKEISKVDLEIVKTKDKLVAAMKDRKVMEKLKETALQAFIDEYNEADAKLIEEIVNYSNNKANGD